MTLPQVSWEYFRLWGSVQGTPFRRAVARDVRAWMLIFWNRRVISSFSAFAAAGKKVALS